MQKQSTSQQPGTIAISVVSNSQLLRKGLLTILNVHGSLSLAGMYAGEPGGVNFQNPGQHVVLLDSGIGNAACLEWIRFCRSLSNPVPVLLLELVNDIDVIISCIEAGINGYTLQGASPAEVMRAIQQVHSGITQCSPEVTAQLFARLAHLRSALTPSLMPHSMPLTPRELEVLSFVAQGYSNKQIAETLFIGLRTVKQHVHNILEKLNCSHRQEAARTAYELGWFSGGSIGSQRKNMMSAMKLH